MLLRKLAASTDRDDSSGHDETPPPSESLPKCQERKDLIKCLYRRLALWEDGDIEDLLREARVLQRRMSARKVTKREVAAVARLFAGHLFRGDSRAALQLLDEQA